MRAVRRNDPPRNDNNSSVALAPVQARPGRVVNKVSPPTTVELRGVPIHFPFKPYKCQEDYMGKVLDALLKSENALLESPTGTGKTLCLLCATLAWQREQARLLYNSVELAAVSSSSQTNGKPSHRAPTIIYASRTHSQLSQVVRELRNTRYRPKHAVLGSREQMCVNPKVKKATSTSSEINHDCSKLGKDRKCRFKNKLEGFKAPSNESGAGGTQPVMDMEDLVTMGNTHKVCPFYYTRSLVEEAELILVPYNYLFDKEARSSTLADVPWDNAVVIFDEAHNLESFASESASFDLTSTDIAGCVSEVQRAIGYNEAVSKEDIKHENLIRLKAIFLTLEEYVLKLNNQSAYVGEFMMEIFEKGASINHANHQIFLNEMRKVTDLFMEMQGGSNSRGAPRLDHFVACVKRVFGEPTEARCLAKAKSYRVHVTPKATGSGHNNAMGRTVSYWCFAPAEAMRELANLNVRSILVTSGTLSPLESYAMELDLPFPHRIENPHIIPDDQIHVRVVSKGVSGKLLSSSYERRQDSEYFNELGNTLVSLGKVIPGGMLVFFPSYGVMEACLERWGGPVTSRRGDDKNKPSSFFAARRKSETGSARYSFPFAPSSTFSASKETPTPWKRLLATKAVVVEPKSTTDLPDAIAEFHKFLNLPKSTGCALFGVCRGKISEGIDFAHDMCRAVIINGLPFAPSFDPKVKMKREFLDGNRASESVKASGDGGFGGKDNTTAMLSGHEWYTQQAHRAVNQAIGRVIRNKDDYGAILLLDSRFSQPRNQEGLSKWVRPHIQNDEGMGRAIASLVQFYRNAEQKAKLRELEPPPPPAPNDVAIILRYEEEGKENQADSYHEDDITRVTLIRNSKGSNEHRSVNGTANASEGDDQANSPSRSYIPADRIVARMDVKSISDESREKDLTRISKDSNIPKSKTDSLEELYTAKKEIVATKECDGSAQTEQRAERGLPKRETSTTNFAKGETTKASSPNNVAVQFFQRAQACMSSSELSLVKKAIVAMKGFGQKDDRKAYLQSARDIVRVVIIHETFGNQPRRQKPEMLSFLLRLLPDKYRTDVQRITMIEVLDQSNLGKLLKANLPPESYKACRSSVSTFLWTVWFDDQEAMSPADYLQRTQTLLKSTLRDYQGETSATMAAFSKLVPSDYRMATIALIDEVKASKKILRMKHHEKLQCGEDVIEPALFRRGVLKRGATVEPTSSGPPSKTALADDVPNDQVQDHKALSEDGFQKEVVTMKKKRLNPYASKDEAGGPSRNIGDNPAITNRPGKMSRTGMLKGLLSSGPAPPDNSTDSYLVKKLVKQSESDTFLGRALTSRKNTIESNAPKTLTCMICEKSSTTPFIADCGHMACFECWMLWLQRSESCAVCRAPCTKSSLARAVFQNDRSENPLTKLQQK